MSRHAAPRRHRQITILTVLLILTIAAIITGAIWLFLILGWLRWLLAFATYIAIVGIVVGLAHRAGVEPPERESAR